MGPWLIFAALLNGAAVALYEVRYRQPHTKSASNATEFDVMRFLPRQGSPLGRDFGTFVATARVTMLGLVPR